MCFTGQTAIRTGRTPDRPNGQSLEEDRWEKQPPVVRKLLAPSNQLLAASEANWVLADEPADARVVVSGAVIRGCGQRFRRKCSEGKTNTWFWPEPPRPSRTLRSPE